MNLDRYKKHLGELSITEGHYCCVSIQISSSENAFGVVLSAPVSTKQHYNVFPNSLLGAIWKAILLCDKMSITKFS